MKIFIELEFIENFEIEFSERKNSQSFKIIYSIFTEYTNIECFLNIDDDKLEVVISDSELLTKLADNNPRIHTRVNLKESVFREKSIQTLVFTAEKRDWFNELEKESILFFTYNDFEPKISEFIERTHKKFDLSDLKTKFDWKYFEFISIYNGIVFFSDPYILVDNDGKKLWIIFLGYWIVICK